MAFSKTVAASIAVLWALLLSDTAAQNPQLVMQPYPGPVYVQQRGILNIECNMLPENSEYELRLVKIVTSRQEIQSDSRIVHYITSFQDRDVAMYVCQLKLKVGQVVDEKSIMVYKSEVDQTMSTEAMTTADTTGMTSFSPESETTEMQDEAAKLIMEPSEGILKVNLDDSVVIKCCMKPADLQSRLFLLERPLPVCLHQERQLPIHIDDSDPQKLCIKHLIVKVTLDNLKKQYVCKLEKESVPIEEKSLKIELKDSSRRLSMEPYPGPIMTRIGDTHTIACTITPPVVDHTLRLISRQVLGSRSGTCTVSEKVLEAREVKTDPTEMRIEFTIDGGDSIIPWKEFVCQLVKDNQPIDEKSIRLQLQDLKQEPKSRLLVLRPKLVKDKGNIASSIESSTESSTGSSSESSSTFSEMELTSPTIEPELETVLALNVIPSRAVRKGDKVRIQCCLEPVRSGQHIRLLEKTRPGDVPSFGQEIILTPFFLGPQMCKDYTIPSVDDKHFQKEYICILEKDNIVVTKQSTRLVLEQPS